MVLRPLKDGNPAGAELLRVCVTYHVSLSWYSRELQALMSHICIRRTKEVGVLIRFSGNVAKWLYCRRCKTRMATLWSRYVSNMSTIVFSVTNTEEYSGGYYYRAGHVDAASKSEHTNVSLSHTF